MRRALATVSLIFSLLFMNSHIATASQIKPGNSCAKTNQLVKVGSQVLVCTKVKTSLVWKVATSAQTVKYFEQNKSTAAESPSKKKCIVGAECAVGSVGPAGGIVFYDAGTQQSWGRYLEVAPNGWAGTATDPSDKYWCYMEGDLAATLSLKDQNFSDSIGSGRSNTSILTSKCAKGAALRIKEYRGGGKGDWFLPSKDEWNELCKFVTGQDVGYRKELCEVNPNSLTKGFSRDYYWTSSLWERSRPWIQNLLNGISSVDDETFPRLVRPIRAF